jgi:hypothetical protein
MFKIEASIRNSWRHANMARKKTRKMKIVVTCPKCGRQGTIGVDKFLTRGKHYVYLVVRHYERGRVQRCILKKIPLGCENTQL